MRRRPLITALAGLLLLGGAGWAALPGGPARGEVQPEGRVVVATGSTKGVYHGYGSVLAAELQRRAPAVRTSVDVTTGSVDNLLRLTDGRADVAFAAGDAVAEAYQGRPPFRSPAPLRAVARVYDDYVHLVVPVGSTVRSVRDLVGRRVSLGSAGSGTELIAGRVLTVAGVPRTGPDGVRPVRLGLDESVAALAAGRVDAFFWSGGLPTGGVEELAATLPLRLVPLGPLADGMREQFGSAYRAATVPAGVYGGTERVSTIAVPNLLVCRADADPLLVQRLTQTLFTAREALRDRVPQADALDERAAIATFPLPLHPGAERYFRDTKL